MSNRRVLTAYGRRRVRLGIAALVAAGAGAVGCLLGNLVADAGIPVGLLLGALAVANVDLTNSRMLQVRLGRRRAVLLLRGFRWRHLMLDERLRVVTTDEGLVLSGQPIHQRVEILQAEFRQLDLPRVASWLNVLTQRDGVAHIESEPTPTGFETSRTPLFATLLAAHGVPQRGLRAVTILSAMAALILVELLRHL